VIPAHSAALPIEAAVTHLKGAFQKVYEDECRRLADLLPILRLTHPNVLIVRSALGADRTFERMRPYLRTPIRCWAPLDMPHPPASDGTLVIQGVEGLSAAQQERLLTSTVGAAFDAQIVSIAGEPLFPLVRRGAFMDRLYYQLNMVYLELTAPPEGVHSA
jgi:hypothetical protein